MATEIPVITLSVDDIEGDGDNYHTPYLILSHYWNPNPKTEVSTSAAYTFGRGESTALQWYDSNASYDDWNYTLSGDPRPDYYRWLPSSHKREVSGYWLDGQVIGTFANAAIPAIK